MDNECVFCGKEIDKDYPTACDECQKEIVSNGVSPYWWMTPEETEDFGEE